MHRERGFALPTVLFLLILAAAGSALIATRILTTHQETAVQATSTQALWAVEGAIETARHAGRLGEAPPAAVRIGGYDVAIEVTKTDERSVIHARTVPNIAEVRVTLDAAGQQTGWKRVR